MVKDKKEAAYDGNNDFPKKWNKLLSDSWKTTAESYDNDELKKKIVDAERAISDFEKDMEADQKLQSVKTRLTELKEELKEMSADYMVPLKECQAQIKYSVHLLQQRGVAR